MLRRVAAASLSSSIIGENESICGGDLRPDSILDVGAGTRAARFDL